MKKPRKNIRNFAGSFLICSSFLVGGIPTESLAAEIGEPAIWPERSAPVGTYDMGIYGWYLMADVNYDMVVVGPDGLESTTQVLTDSTGAIAEPHVVEATDADGNYEVRLVDPTTNTVVATTTFFFNHMGME